MTRYQYRYGREQRAGDRSSTNPPTGTGEPDAIIDDFESGSLGAYGGDTGSASIIQSPVWEGSNALSVGGHNQAIVSTSGLNAYFSKGERMYVYVRKPTMGSTTRVFFRAPDRLNAVAIDLEKWDNFVLKSRDNGFENILGKADDVGIATGKWYRVELVQDDGTMGGSDNEIRARLVDPADNSVLGSELTYTTSYLAGQTGVGFANWTQTAGGDISQFDYAHRPGSTGGQAPNRLPDAAFSHSPADPTLNDQITFDGSPSSDPDGEIVEYEWDLTGDGTTDATGETTTHSYAEAGDYPVTLLVRDDVGAINTASLTVGVAATSLAVTTRSESDITDTSATLNGELTDLGGTPSADCYFEWREVGADSWQSTPVQSLTATGAYSETVSGLASGSTYEFRAIASTGDGTAIGSERQFTVGTVMADVWVHTFDNVPPEALKEPSNRDSAQLESELLARGWDWVNNHAISSDDKLFYNPTDVSRSADQSPPEGTYAGEWRYVEGSDMGWDMRRRIGGDTAGAELEEAWAQYWLKFESAFNTNDQDHADWDTSGGKMPGWAHGLNIDTSGAGRGPPDGTDEWSARMMFHQRKFFWDEFPESGSGDPVVLSYYVYHPDQGSNYGDTVAWDHNADAGKTVDGTPGVVSPGNWYEITLHAKMNTPGVHDGVLEGWVDGELAYTRDNFMFRDVGGEHLDIGMWWHVSYFGGNWRSPRTQSAFCDHVRIYSQNPL